MNFTAINVRVVNSANPDVLTARACSAQPEVELARR